MNIFKQALSSQSYAVQGAALTAISQLDPQQALPLAKGFEKDNKGALTQAIITVYAISGGDDQWAYVFKAFNDASPQGKFNMIRSPFAAMIGHVNNPTYAQQGIAAFKDFGVKYKRFGIAPNVLPAN